ncbi:MATE family efflux transporter [Acidaminobacter sp. JC074]|uniref:MATE family efflux transporter n=1 Tax=Acidaminobacter sp. JC074 TaxID=2530199 RepID=UPI001F0F28C0|nr:MATE family efflux transporter [Acidaminobacter sp. JC074]MCH4886814.1 MATE family efflux transporter [Acidaminobacter sp. JC074]
MIDTTKGSIGKHIRDMAIPTVGGGIAFALFNITDTYFVGKLGTESLAAMGFTFPVVMIASSLSFGISTGASSLVSRLVGSKNHEKMERVTTDGIILSLILVVLFSILGLTTMDFIFPLLGANTETLPLVKEYMTIWYSCVFVVLMPPISDGAMRALGDAIRPFQVMITCAVLNIILDPIFIFGWFGFPAMGIRGAAIATVVSRFAGMLVSLFYLHFHYKLISFKNMTFKKMMASWREILHIGVPSVGVSIVPQLLRTLLTAMAASVGGTVAVAAVAVGSRIEGFVNIASGSISTSIIPIIGQNWGAKKYDRVYETKSLLMKLAVVVSGVVIIAINVFATPIVNIFTSDPEVVAMAITYLRIMLLGYFGLNFYTWNGNILNAIGKSSVTFRINVGGTLLLMMPAVFIGSRISFSWMLIGLIIAQSIVGFISIGKTSQTLQEEEVKLQKVA